MYPNKSLNNLKDKYKAAIASVSDERNNGDGWWIYLKEPYYNQELECRVIHENKIGDCITLLKRIVDNNIIK